MPFLPRALAFAATVAIAAYLYPPVLHFLSPHPYSPSIISLSPLLILIPSFLTPPEAAALIALGTPLLTPSPITGSGTDDPDTSIRTSSSAPLPPEDAVVSCVLARARSLLVPGVLRQGRDDMGMPQMVRYTAGQRFDVHADWFARPRLDPADAGRGRRRLYNRAATVFVVLENNSTAGGETWFPEVEVEVEEGGQGNHGVEAVSAAAAAKDHDAERLWRVHERGGVAFRPVAGNALVWVNLLPNGTGDARVVHAGLPIVDGVKTGMNIWPRMFFGPDA